MPKLLVLSGPSGSGKTSVAAIMCGQYGWNRSVSVTTRTPRAGETNDIDYTFVSIKEFKSMESDGRFIETAHIADNFYGTPTPRIKDQSSKVLMTIDPQGMHALKNRADKTINITTVFLSVPHDELRHRLIARNQDTTEVIARRMQDFASMMEQAQYYDHIIPNTDLESTVARLISILGH